MNRKCILAMLATFVLALGACGKKEEAPKTQPVPPPTTAPAPPAAAGVTVSALALGNAIGADKKASGAADSFGAKDTIYASVETTGAGTATLKAKWTYRKDGQEALVKEETQTIAPSGPANSEFHVSKPDGWPTGDYRVEIFVADRPAGSKDFKVK